MLIKQLYTGCLSQAAYYIESDGEAGVIDPIRETEPYVALAQERNAKIKYIFETHFHADFVSGHVDLARKTGAAIVFGPNTKTIYPIHVAKDGEEFRIGKLVIIAIHTPGHTLESTTWLIKDEHGKDHAIFSGDTLFIGDVGRPDLAIKSDLTTNDLAGMLYDSLHSKILPLGDDVIVYPAHGAGSACGKHISKETFATLGNQKHFNYALQSLSRDEFIKQVTEGITPAPEYFAKDALINQTGYASLDDIRQRGLTPLSPKKIKADLQEGALLIDTRSPEAFVKGHIPGSLFIGIDGQFAIWAATLIPDLSRPVIYIVEPGRENEVVTRLARVGYDNTIGYLNGGIDAWVQDGGTIAVLNSITPQEFEKKVNQQNVSILDVRKPSEYETLHVQGAENFPLDFINDHYNELDKQKTYYVHCQGGYRSVIASSILQSIGFEHLVNVEEGFAGIQKTSVPVSANVIALQV